MRSIYLYCLAAFFCCNALKAQQVQTEDTGDVIFKSYPGNSNAMFTSTEPVSYRLSLKNTTNTVQKGRVSYIITTDKGKKTGTGATKIELSARASQELHIRIPPKATGIYRVQFMLNLPDYDDTIRRVFGVNPNQIRSTLHRPADFDEFWRKTRKELDQVAPEYKITERKDLSTTRKKVFAVEMQSYGHLLIRGWLVIPRDGKKFPVHYRVPGYVVALKPNMDNDDYVAFDINVRGNGNSNDAISIGTDNYCLVNIQDKNKYIYRGVIMDCQRGMDFLYSHPELGIDTSKIFVEGGSQGGALALITAALDHRIKVLTMQVPLYSDIRDDDEISASYEVPIFPFKVFRKYLEQHPSFTTDKFYATWDYYDPQNFAPLVNVPVLMGIGMLDEVCPPYCSIAMFNHISSKNKEYNCSANTTHEVDYSYFMFQNMWLREKLRMP